MRRGMVEVEREPPPPNPNPAPPRGDKSVKLFPSFCYLSVLWPPTQHTLKCVCVCVCNWTEISYCKPDRPETNCGHIGEREEQEEELWHGKNENDKQMTAGIEPDWIAVTP